MDSLHHGFSINEINNQLEENNSLEPLLKIKNYRKDYSDSEFCYKCDEFRIRWLQQEGGYYVCESCGEIGGYNIQNEWIPQIWLKNKSVHKRDRWFEKKCRK